jgi:hypothetical protein
MPRRLLILRIALDHRDNGEPAVAHGPTQLATSAHVAAALRPLADRFVKLLCTIGIVGTELLAIPTLAGSAAYASLTKIAEPRSVCP